MNNSRTCDELKARLDEIAYEIGVKQRPDLSAEAARKSKAYSDAFWRNMASGEPNTALREGSDGAGGYLVPDAYDKRLVEALEGQNVLRRLGTTLPTKTRLKIPTTESRSEAQWVDENHAYIDTGMSFNQIVIDAYKATTSTLVSDELLEDGAIDLEAYLTREFGEALGKLEEDAFAVGDGVNKPTGLVHQAQLGAVTEEVGLLQVDDMVDLMHSVRKPYRDNAVWVMSEDALTTLQKVKVYNGRYLWNGDYAKMEPLELFGCPIYICNHLPDVVPGAKPVLFGDFRYFWIGDRGKRVFKRLDEKYADHGQVCFMAYQRVDAKLVLPEAVKSLQIRE